MHGVRVCDYRNEFKRIEFDGSGESDEIPRGIVLVAREMEMFEQRNGGVKTDHVVPRDVSVERPEVKKVIRGWGKRRCGRRGTKEDCDAASAACVDTTPRIVSWSDTAELRVLRTARFDLGMSVDTSDAVI